MKNFSLLNALFGVLLHASADVRDDLAGTDALVLLLRARGLEAGDQGNRVERDIGTHTRATLTR